MKDIKKQIVIFASGNGTNAENIIKYFKNSDIAKVVLVLSNKNNAKVLERASRLNVDSRSFSREELHSNEGVAKILKDLNPDLIVLAGFLLKFPESIIKEFPNKVINIHPALLPKYGGKGMYGSFVHEAVIENKEVETGISIHYIDENYDEGEMIFQKSVKVSPEDTAATIADKIHLLEHEWFPQIIEKLLKPSNSN